jgi:hypothetical protein
LNNGLVRVHREDGAVLDDDINLLHGQTPSPNSHPSSKQ